MGIELIADRGNVDATLFERLLLCSQRKLSEDKLIDINNQSG